jgi:hypothetical protein
MTPVRSSVIAAVGHDGGRTLTVQFLNGEIHKYVGVTPATHQQLLGARSVGSFFARHIKPRYRSTRVT